MTTQPTVQQNHEVQGDASRPEFTQQTLFTPRVDIVETPEELVLFADLPGVQPGDADVRFENGELVVRGRQQPRHQGKTCLWSESEPGHFYRVFRVSEAIDAGKITAELKNGVLTVHLPKAEVVKPRRITVQGA